MSQNENAAKVGAAWALHRQGNNDAAIREFNNLARQEDNAYDALYGLGLSQRAAGMKDAALRSFQDALAIINRKLMENPGEDHFEIMQRMTSQRIAELSK